LISVKPGPARRTVVEAAGPLAVVAAGQAAAPLANENRLAGARL
jgi:hypothetical protein